MVNNLTPLPAISLAGMTEAEIGVLSVTAISSLNASALETLPVALLRELSADQIASVSAATLSALDPEIFGQFLRNEVVSLTPDQIASLTTSEVGTLSKGKLAKLSAAQVAAIDPAALASLGAGRVGSLSATQIAGLTISQLGALNIREAAALAAKAMVVPGSEPKLAVLAGMTEAEIGALSVTAISSLNASALETLPVALLRELSADQIASVSAATLSALDPEIFGQFLRNEVASLTPDQIASLTTSEVGTLSKGKLAKLSAAQVAVIDPAALASLGAGRVGSLSATQIAGLTISQLGALNIREIATLAANATVLPAWGSRQVSLLTASTIGNMSVETFDQIIANNIGYLTSLSGVSLTDFQSLTKTQIETLAPAKLASLDAALISQINPSYFTTTQISSFSSTLLSNLTTTFFSSLPSASLASILTSNLVNLGVPDIVSLNATQIAGLTQTQLSAMSSEQLGIAFNTFNPLTAEAQQFENNGVLGATGAATLLYDIASGGDTPVKFQELIALGNSLQASNNITNPPADNYIVTTPAVRNLFDNVVFGNYENAIFNGGSPYLTALGNLSDTTPAYLFDSLIDKWFSGSDMPTLQIDVAGTTLNTTYAQNDSPLYNSSGVPDLTDVMEGSLNDSALLAGIAETALQDPLYINQLITDIGDGLYEVELPNIFGSSFVTVNDELPVPTDGKEMAIANTSTGKWAALLEKAAAQNAVNSALVLGQNSDPSPWNSYASVTVNTDEQIMLYSGQFYNSASFSSVETLSAMNNDLLTAEGAFSNGNNVILMDENHFLAVTDIDVVNGLVSTYDPLGGKMSTTSLSSMSKNGDTLYFGVSDRAGL